MPSNLRPNVASSWWRERFANDLPASFVTFLVALPLSMGIAIASGAPVSAGLVTGVVGGIVAGLLAGSPLQVSGPAAGLTVIVYACIRQYGIEELGVVVLLAGAMQVLAGILRLGQWFRAVSPAVVQGMLAGIGVLIFSSQFHVMVDDKPKGHGLENLATIPEAISKALPSRSGETRGSERSTRTAILREAGLLHLKQVEIGESVHHLLTGITSAPDGEQAPVAEEPDTSEDRLAGDGLRELAATQRDLLERLKQNSGLRDAAQMPAALCDVRAALGDLEAGDIHSARASQDRAADSIAELRDSVKSHRWAATIGLLTIGTLVFWQTVVARRITFVPAPLVAVIVATATAFVLDLPVLYVEVPDNLLEEIYLPTLAELKTLWQPGLLLIAVQVAVVASAETLLCATAVDQMHQGPRTRYDRELFAQGVGNMLCGLLSAVPMTGVIVRSTANIQAGAKSRWSAVLHGVWLLLFVAGLSFLLRLIPTASLAAILVYTGYKLVNLKAVRTLWKFGRIEAVIYLTTMGAIVATDLLIGVLAGFALSILSLLYTFTHLRVALEHAHHARQSTMRLKGAATFVKLPRLAQALEQVPPGYELHVDLERLAYIDHACLDLLMNWQKRHESTGGQLVIDWNSLTAKFRAPHTGASSAADRRQRRPGSATDASAVPEQFRETVSH